MRRNLFENGLVFSGGFAELGFLKAASRAFEVLVDVLSHGISRIPRAALAHREKHSPHASAAATAAGPAWRTDGKFHYITEGLRLPKGNRAIV